MKIKLLILLSASCLALQWACGGGSTKPMGTKDKPLAVTLITAQHESVPAYVEVPGKVQARNRIVLSSQINGFVRDMNVREGDSVQSGQVLVTLDARDAESQKAMAQASVDEAQAALAEARKAHQAALERLAAARAADELARQTYLRYQKLYESRSVSPQEMDEVKTRRDASTAELSAGESMVAAAQERIKQVEARIVQAKAQMARADVLVGWTQIKAPSSGRIVERLVDAGTAIFPGTPLVVLESSLSPQVVADIPTAEAHRLQKGLAVRLRNNQTGALLEGRVAEIVPLSNTLTHSLQFKIDLPPGAPVTNGQYLKVEIPAGTRQALLVPEQAIRETGQLTGLFVVGADSRARFRLVKTIPYDAGRVEVVSGLESGEKVVTSLSGDLTDGTTVEKKP